MVQINFVLFPNNVIGIKINLSLSKKKKKIHRKHKKLIEAMSKKKKKKIPCFLIQITIYVGLLFAD